MASHLPQITVAEDVCPGCGGYRAAVAAAPQGRSVAVTGPEHQLIGDETLLDLALKRMDGQAYTDPDTGDLLRSDSLIVDLWAPPNWTPTGRCP